MPRFDDGVVNSKLEKGDIILMGNPTQYGEILAENFLVEDITRANLQTLISASELVRGKCYRVTDAVGSTLSLIVQALTANTITDVAYNTINGDLYTYNITADTATQGIVSDVVDFDPQTAPAYLRGRVWYDSDTESLSYYDDISGTSNQIGKEEHVRVRNTTGVTITNGSVVYVSGATGQTPQITLAQANADATSNVIGIATHDIDNNAFGKVTTFGVVNDVNTLAFAEGSILYLSQSVAGGLTSTRPSAPNFAVIVGICLHSHATQGKILVNTNKQGLGFGTANQLLGINAGATGQEYKILNGTSNQVTVTNSVGGITLSLPQSIATTSSPTFSRLALGTGALLTTRLLPIDTNLSGGTVVRGVEIGSTIQSDVTNTASIFRSNISTEASAFTLSNLIHFTASQSTIGATSIVTTQTGFSVDSSLIGATNNFGFRGLIPSGTGRWNIYMDGTANNYFNGNVQIGSTSNPNSRKLLVSGTFEATGATTLGSTVVINGATSYAPLTIRNFNSGAYAEAINLDINSDVVGSSIGIDFNTSNVDLGAIAGARIQGIRMAASAVTDLSFSTRDGAALNEVLRLTSTRIAQITGTLTISGAVTGSSTAQFTKLGLGTNSLNGFVQRITTNINGATTAYGVSVESISQSDVTTSAVGYASFIGTQDSAYTLNNLTQFLAIDGTKGASNTITNNYGFRASGLTNGVNNYGFFSAITSGSGRWNFYANGTASNYFNGTTLFGTTTDNGVDKVQINGSLSSSMGTTLYTAVNTGQFANITAGGLSAANLAIGIGGTSIGAMLQGRTSTASSRLHLNPYGGNVLIGKGGIADSGELLQVQGAASVSGNTTVGGTLGVTGVASVGQLASGNGTGERYVTINGGAGSLRYLELQSSGSSRWVLRASNIAESGSNAGSDLQLVRYSDVGANLGTALSINRATGLTTLSSLSVSGTLAVTGAVTLGTALGVASGGLGITTTPSNGFIPIGNGTNYVSAAITGTANQVTVTNGAGTITLSLPQSIATTSTPQFAGIGLGGALTTSNTLLLTGNARASGAVSLLVAIESTITSATTSSAQAFRARLGTEASSFTLNNLFQFIAAQGTFGAGSTVTNQYGYYVDSSLTGATNNYGFFGGIASGVNRWNFYGSGTAANAFVGQTIFGSTTLVTSALVALSSTTQGFRPPVMTTAQRDAIVSPTAGLMIYNTTTNKLNVYTTAWEAITSA